MQILPNAVPESMFLLIDFAVITRVGFRMLLVYCESGFQKPLQKAYGRFQLALHDHGNTFILISGFQKGFPHS
jgi:hypothetical protein